MSIQTTMHKKKETKNTYVYFSEDSTAAIPTLYIKKSAFAPGSEVPEVITITVETKIS